jgi:hypothetical protein
MSARWPSYAEIELQLRRWAHEHPQRITLQDLGTTAGGRKLWAARVTDSEVDADAQEHVLITANHSGARERTATTGVLCLLRWLLSDDPLAASVRRRQVVACMPVGVPDSYEQELGVQNAHGLSPCNDWSLDGPLDPECHPEGVAVQQLMDQLQPEVHSDYHGLDLTFPGHIAIENTGASYGNSSLRPYCARLVRLMDEAALEEGFPSDLQEQDAERLLWGPALDEMAAKTWSGRPQVFAGIYCYARYHSIVLHSEVFWERSGLLKHRRMLQAGNEIWPGEHYAGYPTRVIKSASFDMVTAYGETAAARRRSRVELWNRQEQILQAEVNPQKEGILFYVCATTPQARLRWLSDCTLRGFVDGLREHPGVEHGPIEALVADYPLGAGQWGAEANVSLPPPDGDPPTWAPLTCGLGLRLRIPYPRAILGTVLLNGSPIQASATERYQTWTARGFTYLQINISPQRARAQELFVVTCRYDPVDHRTQGVW